jgi:hypothetical protein
MLTFLLTWNENKWPWETLAKDVARVQSGSRVTQKYELWSSGNRKNIDKGDRLFLLKQGGMIPEE